MCAAAVVQIINKDSGYFDDDDIELLEDFSVHVGVALGRLHTERNSPVKKRKRDTSVPLGNRKRASRKSSGDTKDDVSTTSNVSWVTTICSVQ